MAAKRPGVTRKVNRNQLHAGDKAGTREIHPGLENQGGHHQKSKTWVSVAPQKGMMYSKTNLIKHAKM